MEKANDVIAAIATASGRGGIGIVRVSGPDLKALIRGVVNKTLEPRTARFARFLDAGNNALDEGIALYFPAPHSYTGEHVLELQGHGGPRVLEAVLGRCLELGARLAEPGEFTRRAFLNGKMDLAQAEAVADLIDAASSSAARAATRSLEGAFSRHINALRDALIELRMLVEATLDFPEEEIDFVKASDARGRLDSIRQSLNHLRDTARQGALLREGLSVVLIGQPNVGKSSLLNSLAGYEAAIVTEFAGTTRDALREAVQIEGVPLNIIDTAGLRETGDSVERIGIERAWREIEKADVALLLVDAQHGRGPSEERIVARLGRIPLLTLHNKIDLSGHALGIEDGGDTLYLSAKTGAGLDLLRRRLLEIAGWQGLEGEVFLARRRHLDALQACAGQLEAAATQTERIELFAEELRLAQQALGRITGEYTADDLLGEIFSRFCMGK
jgi:tRNA modification GTPase